MRSTSTSSASSRAATADSIAPGSTPVTSIRHVDAVNNSANGTFVAGTTASTSMPGGSAALSESLTASGSHSVDSPSSRYSASVAAPVGDALAYEMRGWGEKPEE